MNIYQWEATHFAIPANNMYRRAAVAANRPLVCACNAYSWLHRRGFGLCQLGTATYFKPVLLNSLNRKTREISLEIQQQRNRT